jgi:uncharacterized protein YifN (PemK superfamily)
MVKRRRVVVLTPRFRHRYPSTVVVVPISTSVPSFIQPYHYRLTGSYVSLAADSWIKGDMVGNVALARLSVIVMHGKTVKVVLSAVDLEETRAAVAAALGTGPHFSP